MSAAAPGQTVEEVGRKYRSLSVGSRKAPDGTVVLSVEIGVVLPLFEGPSVHSPKVTHIETNRAGEGLAAHSSPARVAVFDAQPGWFQVALRSDDYRNAKRAWLQASALWRFIPMNDEAEVRELAERTWGPEDLSVRVVGLQTVDGALWANVELMSASECASWGQPTLRARGWVPVHAANGSTSFPAYRRMAARTDVFAAVGATSRVGAGRIDQRDHQWPRHLGDHGRTSVGCGRVCDGQLLPRAGSRAAARPLVRRAA